MGREILCQMCGVSFSVGRIRTASEPRGAAWSNYGRWDRNMRGWVSGERHPQNESCLPALGNENDRPEKSIWRVTTLTACAEDMKRAREAFEKRAEQCGCKSIRRETPLSRTEREMLNWADEARSRYKVQKRGIAQPAAERRFNYHDWEEDEEDEVDSVGQEDFEPSEASHNHVDPLEYVSDVDSDFLDDYAMEMETSEAKSSDTPTRDAPKWTFSVAGRDPLKVTDTVFAPISSSWTKRRPRQKTTTDNYEIVGSETDSELESENESKDDSNGSYIRPPRGYHHHYLYEHIAGPDCVHTDGYHGDRISVDEMLHSRTAQFLASKNLVETFSTRWTPEDDDLEFERASKCFLTGLSKDPPRSDENTWLFPIRHGVGNVFSANYCDGYSEMQLPEYAVAFHPACFELFRQASCHTFNGQVEIDGLMDFYEKASAQRDSYPLDWDKDCKKSFAQGTSCLVGTEYLVANPVYVPKLTSIIKSAVVGAEAEANFSIRDSPFPYRPPARAATKAGDPFLKLPVEVLHILTDLMGSKEIASLRLASHAFQQLPIFLWYRLVIKELPFLYEAWSRDVQPYAWAARLPTDYQEYQKIKAERVADRDHRRRVIEEDMPEIMQEWLQYEPTIDDTELEVETMCDDSRRILTYTPVRLHLKTTNWYQLYREITINWDQLKGLQNRERVWKYVKTIVGAIEARKARGDQDTEISM